MCYGQIKLSDPLRINQFLVNAVSMGLSCAHERFYVDEGRVSGNRSAGGRCIVIIIVIKIIIIVITVSDVITAAPVSSPL